VVFTVLYAWPFIEARVTGDRDEHHLLDRPRDRPVRTALGAAAISGFVVLLLAGSDDVFVAEFDWSIVTVRDLERILFLVLPALVGIIVWKIARDLSRAEPPPRAQHPPPAEPRPVDATVTGGSRDRGAA
jgi:ubiquinol-cytochrome c reductase cytochrome b subunit